MQPDDPNASPDISSIPSSEPAAEIQPNRASWILPDGRVVSVSDEGWNEDQTAFSHGIFVRRWVEFRTSAFHPDPLEVAAATLLSQRACYWLRRHPELLGEESDNPFAGDSAWNQAAEEQGWIRIKPLPHPVLDGRIFWETGREPMTAAVLNLLEAVRCRGLTVHLLRGGALANRGFWIEATKGTTERVSP